MTESANGLARVALDPTTPPERVAAALAALRGSAGTGKKETGFFSEKEARDFLGGISRMAVWQLRHRGLKSYRVGRRVLYDPKELHAFVTADCSPERTGGRRA